MSKIILQKFLIIVTNAQLFSFANILVLLWNQNVSEIAVTTTTIQDHLVFLVPIFDREWKIRK